MESTEVPLDEQIRRTLEQGNAVATPTPGNHPTEYPNIPYDQPTSEKTPVDEPQPTPPPKEPDNQQSDTMTRRELFKDHNVSSMVVAGALATFSWFKPWTWFKGNKEASTQPPAPTSPAATPTTTVLPTPVPQPTVVSQSTTTPSPAEDPRRAAMAPAGPGGKSILQTLTGR